ncbi:hypothetical protein EB093_09325 [bacterium]|nr:hypothetical protein [bacterium]
MLIYLLTHTTMNTKIGFPVQIIQSCTLARGLRPPYSVTRRFNGHTNAKKLIPPSGRTDSNEALATKDQLHRVELGLIKEISGVREGLTKEISSVESRLTEKFTKEISGVREGLTKEISGVREGLTKEISGVREGLTKEISGVREGLTKEISSVESRLTEKFTKEISSVESRLTDKMSKNHAELLVAIQAQNTKFETQNTKFESFKLHVYRLIGSVVAAAIGIANRDKIMQGLSSSIKP